MKQHFTFSLLILLLIAAKSISAQGDQGAKATNPIIWADVPDVAMVRVGDTYYMSSTTMHMSPS